VQDAALKPQLRELAELWRLDLKGQIALAALPNIQGSALTVVTEKMEGSDYRKSIDAAGGSEKSPVRPGWSSTRWRRRADLRREYAYTHAARRPLPDLPTQAFNWTVPCPRPSSSST